jgi:hypothetical protein
LASPEWQLLSTTFMTAATIGFVYGGLRTTPESIRRFDLYAQGKNFGAVAYHDVFLNSNIDTYNFTIIAT